jgi:hypothetical protein
MKTALFRRSVMKRNVLNREELDEYYKQIITYIKAALASILTYVEAFEHVDNLETDEAKNAYLDTIAALNNCEKIISEANETLTWNLQESQKQSRCVKKIFTRFRDKTLKALKKHF